MGETNTNRGDGLIWYESSLWENSKEAKTWKSMDEEEETLKYFNQTFNDPYF